MHARSMQTVRNNTNSVGRPNQTASCETPQRQVTTLCQVDAPCVRTVLGCLRARVCVRSGRSTQYRYRQEQMQQMTYGARGSPGRARRVLGATNACMHVGIA